MVPTIEGRIWMQGLLIIADSRARTSHTGKSGRKIELIEDVSVRYTCSGLP
jgi:hypothetical protein